MLSPCSHFDVTVSNAEIEKSSKGNIPKNTSRSTSWALRVFTQWIEQRNKRMEITYPLICWRRHMTLALYVSVCSALLAKQGELTGRITLLKLSIKYSVAYFAIQEKAKLIQLAF